MAGGRSWEGVLADGNIRGYLCLFDVLPKRDEAIIAMAG